MKIGVTGGIATGKSFVAQVIAETLGAQYVSADKIAKDLMMDYLPMVQEILGTEVACKIHGTPVYRPDAVIYALSRDLSTFSDFMHFLSPKVLGTLSCYSGPMVVEVPLLFEMFEVHEGWKEEFDKIVMTVCLPEIQTERLKERPPHHFRLAELQSRISRISVESMDISEKKERADLIIDTGESKDDLRDQLVVDCTALVKQERETNSYGGYTDNKAVYPGTFDPITLGHIDVIMRAAQIFDFVYVALAHNPAKSKTMFQYRDRKKMLTGTIQHLSENGIHNVGFIEHSTGSLMVDLADRVGCATIIRGLRLVTDYEEELDMCFNNDILSGRHINTVLIPPRQEHIHVRSSSVRQILSCIRSGNSDLVALHSYLSDETTNYIETIQWKKAVDNYYG